MTTVVYLITLFLVLSLLPVASADSAPAVRNSPVVEAAPTVVVTPAVEAASTAQTTPPAEPAQWQVDDLQGRVFYQIFVRSFCDLDGDGVGDFQGLTSRLDYLNDGDPTTGDDLDVDGVWLMPVFESPSYHGYDTTNYLRINPAYGTEEDFDLFLVEAHRRGIRVVLDLMINHTSIHHPWFLAAALSPDSPRRDWYVWRTDDPGWTQPWGHYPTWHLSHGGWYYYGIFWAGMPDLNFRTPAVREAVEEIAVFWLQRGVDGFRLDAARHIVAEGPGLLQNDTPQTHTYWREFSTFVRNQAPGTLLLGEVWADTRAITAYYGDTGVIRGGDEFNMTFNFPLGSSIVSAASTGHAREVELVLTDMAKLYPQSVLDGIFLANHDMVRLATQLGGDRGAMRMAAAVLLTLPGTPFLYYGEEVGLQNGPTGGDESKRTPMPWDASEGGGFSSGEPWFEFAAGRDSANVATQAGDPGSLLSRYRDLIRVRKTSPALRMGGIEVWQTGSSSVLAFVREVEVERVLVLHNLGDESVEVDWQAYAQSAVYERLFADPGIEDPTDLSVVMPPYATGIWRLH